MIGSLYPLSGSSSSSVFPFSAEGGVALLFQVVTGCRLRLISTVRGESYDDDREEMSVATGTPEEVVGDHSFSLHFYIGWMTL